MSGVGVVCALQAEARCLPEGARVSVSGPGAERAARAARDLLSAGCSALVSWGVAGGTDPGLEPGSLLIPEQVLACDGRQLATDHDWRRELIERLRPVLPVTIGILAHADGILSAPEAKARVFASRDARAVDMESGAVATVACEAAVPLLVIRAVADPAELALPRIVRHGVDSRGRLRPWRVVAGLALHPSEITALVRLAGCFRAARRTLRMVAGCAGPEILRRTKNETVGSTGSPRVHRGNRKATV